MSKGTQLWPGDRMLGFFRAHIRHATSLDEASAERLAVALNKAVNRMLVWEMPDEAQQEPAPAGKTANARAVEKIAAALAAEKIGAQATPEKFAAQPTPEKFAAAPTPEKFAAAPTPEKFAAAPRASERHDRAENFNPYLFSAIVVLAKQGRDGLMKRLQEIKSAEHLRAFAEAQHVPVDPSLKRTDDIRKAIVAAAEQRLADRKAAAS